MREIKFRAWDKTENRMARNVEDLLFNSKGLYGVVLNHMGFAFRRRVKDVILEQYTGLKDKNGKEIFEGDIVRTKLGDVQEIKFISQDFEDGVVRTFVSLSRKPPHLMAMANSDEIIGNIHENPELLEVQYDHNS